MICEFMKLLTKNSFGFLFSGITGWLDHVCEIKYLCYTKIFTKPGCENRRKWTHNNLSQL